MNLLLFLSILAFSSTKTIFSWLVFRHGARTNDLFFSQEMFPTYSRSELTQQGQQMMKLLGNQTKHYLQTKGLDITDKSDTFVISSSKPRTIESVVQYLQGIFGQIDYQLDYQNLYSIDTNFIQQYSEQNQTKHHEIIKIFTTHQSNDHYFHAHTQCKYVRQVKHNYNKNLVNALNLIRKNNWFAAFVNKLNQSYLSKIGKKVDPYNINEKQLSSLRDLIVTSKFHGKQNMLADLPENVNDAIYEFKRDLTFEYSFKNRLSNYISVYYQMRSLYDLLEHVVQSHRTNNHPIIKAVLNSIHDNQLANWLLILIAKKHIYSDRNVWTIPYGTQIILEVVEIGKQLSIQIRVNQRPFEIKDCEVYCPIDKFIQIVKQYQNVQFTQNC